MCTAVAQSLNMAKYGKAVELFCVHFSLVSTHYCWLLLNSIDFHEQMSQCSLKKLMKQSAALFIPLLCVALVHECECHFLTIRISCRELSIFLIISALCLLILLELTQDYLGRVLKSLNLVRVEIHTATLAQPQPLATSDQPLPTGPVSPNC